MARGPSPTLRRRELGVRLRELRTQAGLTAEQVAEQLMVSVTKVTRLETGTRGATMRDIRDLAEIYRISGDVLEHLMTLARQSKEASWWQRYGLEPAYSTFVGLEAAASTVMDYESSTIPALLQDSSYSRALIVGNDPELEEAAAEQQVEARVKRRQLLLTPDRPLVLHAVCDEAALRRIVGDRSIMAEALRTLLEGASLPNVTMQVIPFEAGAHPGLNSTFTILHFEEHVSDVIYVEGLFGQHYLENPGDLARYRRAFERLTSLALEPAASMRMISALAAAYDQ